MAFQFQLRSSLHRVSLAAIALLLALSVILLTAAPRHAAAQAVVAAIDVEGNQRIEAETVRSYMRIAPGEPFNAAKINQSLKSLYATGLFADVRIRRRGDRLLVSVVENPIVNRVAFEGNRRLTDEILLQEVQLRPRTVFSRSKVQSDVQRLLQIYRRNGRFAAAVEPKVIQLPQNRIDLVYEIKEGPVTGIKRIRFVGNRAFSDGRLRRVILTKESRWYRFFSSDDNYDPDRLTFDRELLRRFYLSNGYADFRVISAVAELAQDKSGFFLTFTVDEGPIYRFGKSDVSSALKGVDVDALRKLIKYQSGDIYNAELIEKTIQDITFELGRLGYAFVNVRPRVNRDRKNRTIDITYQIDKGARVYVERINITGNTRTLDKVIRREFRLSEGDAFNAAKLRLSRKRIRALGFFDKVEITNEQGSAADKTVINVDVQEKSTGELSLGAGFSSADNVSGDISIRERNLLGRGQDLKLSLSVSSKRQFIDLGFTEPYFLDKPLAAGFDLFNRQNDYQDVSSYDQNSLGFALRAGFDLTENLRQNVRYQFRRDKITNVGDDASRTIKEQEGITYLSAISYSLRYDRRDDPVEPSTGYVIALSQELAGLGGDIRDLRTTLKYAYYYPFLDDVIGIFSLNEGIVFGIGQDVGISRRFFLGGDSFKGFAQGGLGPRDTLTDDSLGGNLYYVGTAEVKFPIGLPNEFGIAGRLFTQAGSVAGVDDTGSSVFDKGTVRASVGFGVSWRSPFGPIRIDYAIPFLKEDVDDEENFRFSAGTRF